MSDYDYLRKDFESLLDRQGINLKVIDDGFTESIEVIISVSCGSLIAKEVLIDPNYSKTEVIRQIINKNINELKKHMEEVHII